MDANEVVGPEVPGIIINGPDYYPLQTGERTVEGRWDARPPQGGPGWEGSQGEPRAAANRLSFGWGEETWSEDHMSGVHGVIAETESYHYGYMEPWGPDLSIPRNAPAGPWDGGATLVQVSGEVF